MRQQSEKCPSVQTHRKTPCLTGKFLKQSSFARRCPQFCQALKPVCKKLQFQLHFLHFFHPATAHTVSVHRKLLFLLTKKFHWDLYASQPTYRTASTTSFSKLKGILSMLPHLQGKCGSLNFCPLQINVSLAPGTANSLQSDRSSASLKEPFAIYRIWLTVIATSYFIKLNTAYKTRLEGLLCTVLDLSLFASTFMIPALIQKKAMFFI